MVIKSTQPTAYNLQHKDDQFALRLAVKGLRGDTRTTFTHVAQSVPLMERLYTSTEVRKNPKDMYVYSSLYGNVHVVKWMYETLGHELIKPMMLNAAKRNDFAMMQWLYYNGCGWRNGTFNAVVFNDFGEPSVDMLNWMHTHGCPFEGNETNYAVRKNRLRTLRWLIEEADCEYDLEDLHLFAEHADWILELDNTIRRRPTPRANTRMAFLQGIRSRTYGCSPLFHY